MDSDNHGIEDDLKALEHRLIAWQPTAGALDRDRMLYDAGQAAARADGQIRAWRLATAALLFLTVGLGGLLVHQRSLLERERAVLTQERSRRRTMEAMLVDRNPAPAPSAPAPAPTSAGTTVEPLSPSSYFALTARLARDVRDPSSPDREIEPAPHRPSAEPVESLPPLHPRDVQRILDL
jgi:hypothetical protein